MRKTFQLRPEGKHPDRALEAVKHEIRKYIRRERRRELPEGVDFWGFDCRIGTTQQDAQPVHEAELIGQLDASAKAGAEQAYVEVLTKHGHRGRRPAGDDAAPPQSED